MQTEQLFNADDYDIDVTDDNIAHVQVLLEAAAIYNDRSRIRGQHWKSAPLSRHIDNIETKTGRLDMIEELQRVPLPADIDEALDIINYGVFCVRKLRENDGN